MTASTERHQEACSLILLKVKAAASEHGTTDGYFLIEQNSKTESELRLQFDALAARIQHQENYQPDILAKIRLLNSYYRTRFKIDHLPCLQRHLHDAIESNRWIAEPACKLLDSPPDRRVQIASVVKNILKGVKKDCGVSPYSLVTKFLHFCFPSVFAIYDSQVAQSIQMWSIFAFNREDENDTSIESQYDVSVIAKTSGDGYLAILDFYHAVWNAGTPQDHDQIVKESVRIGHFLGQKINQPSVRVSTVDLIDKLVWYAHGNPIRLGLVEKEWHC